MELIDRIDKSSIVAIYNREIKTETAELDYKEIFKFDKRSKVELAKDILAFANTKGGYIIYGVDKYHEWIGLDDRSDEVVDDTQIQQLVDNYIEGYVEVGINEVEINDLEFIVLYISPSKDLLLFKKPGEYEIKSRKTKRQEKKIVFKKNEVYCRRGSRSIIADSIFYRRKRHGFSVVENVSEITRRYNRFVGRKDDLKNLHSKVFHPNTTLVQVDGIGGIGKTTLVHEYCTRLIDDSDKEFENDFEFIIWMSAKKTIFTPRGTREISQFLTNYEDVIQEIINFLDIKSSDLDTDENSDEEKVTDFLTEHKVLLVIDNMETLLDEELISFLEYLPRKSKAVLTTRETISDFQMARVPLVGLSKEDFEEFIIEEYNRLTGKELPKVFNDELDEIYKYTKGMPLAGTLIANQLSRNVDIRGILNGLSSGKTYVELLSFCFAGEFERLNDIEKDILYAFSLCEVDQYLTVDELVIITKYDTDQVGMIGIPNLTKYSLCIRGINDQQPAYSAPYLTKVYAKNSLEPTDKNGIINRFEKFATEQQLIEDTSISDEKFYAKVFASSHKEKLAARNVKNIMNVHFADGYEAALDLLSIQIDNCPKFGYLWFLRGRVLDLSKTNESYNKARRAYLKATELEPRLIEAWIELGFLDSRFKSSNKQKRIELLNNQSIYFQNALKLNDKNRRARLGYGITLTNIAKTKSFKFDKVDKIKTAREADANFDLAYYEKPSLPIRRRMNGTTAHKQATNLMTNLRDYQKAYEVCMKGLDSNPGDQKLRNLKSELMSKVDPETFKLETIKVFEKKGWIK